MSLRTIVEVVGLFVIVAGCVAVNLMEVNVLARGLSLMGIAGSATILGLIAGSGHE
jgi:hypothetical protein